MERLLVVGLVLAARTTDAEAVVVVVVVAFVVVSPLSGYFLPPILCAAVEVEPDEQRHDLEKVELGLRAL